MGFHDQLSFAALHKAVADGGVDASLPASPEGFGDIYWAPDGNSGSGALYISDMAGTAWVELDISGATVNFTDLSDVTITTPAKGGIIAYDGTSDWKNQAVGTNGQRLESQSGQTLGVQWVDNGITNLSDVDTTTTTPVKGTTLVFNGTNFVSVGVGSNNQVLTADSAEATGVKWAAPTGGTGVDSDAQRLALIGW